MGNKKLTIKRNSQHSEHKMKKIKTKTQHNNLFSTTIRKQITYIRYKSSYKQLEEKTNRTSFYAEIATIIGSIVEVLLCLVRRIHTHNNYYYYLLFTQHIIFYSYNSIHSDKQLYV